MGINALSSDDIAKLKEIVEEGVRINQEVDDLRGGLKDTVKDTAEKLDIPVKVINKAIRLAYKDNLQEEQEQQSDVETVLQAVGRG